MDEQSFHILQQAVLAGFAENYQAFTLERLSHGLGMGGSGRHPGYSARDSFRLQTLGRGVGDERVHRGLQHAFHDHR